MDGTDVESLCCVADWAAVSNMDKTISNDNAVRFMVVGINAG
jgi:hypothetical protein